MKSIFTIMFGLAATFSVTAQKVENDDMYFTSKDRVKQNAGSASAVSQVKRAPETRPATAASEAVVGINPTDSYSARNVNPEYSTTNTNKDSQTSADYFVENYVPTGVNSNLKGNYSNSNNACNCAYSNPYNNSYASGYSPYGMSPYSMSPYNTSPYSMYGSMGWGAPYMSMGAGYPYYAGGISMTYGNVYNPWGYSPYQYGAGYGYGNAWANPAALYDPFYSSFYSGGLPFSFYSYGSVYGNGYYSYGNNAVVNSNDDNSGRLAAYQKRADRTTSRDTQTSGTTSAGLTHGSRVSANNSEPYYQRGWRSNMSSANGGTTSRTQWFSTDNSGNSGANWSNSSRTSMWDSGNSFSGGSNSRSSWSPSVGGGGHSMGGGSVGGGGGGGHSRGRD